MSILSPKDLGMPPKFHAGWRPGQGEAIDRICDGFHENRFVVLNAPVGFGKSPGYVAVALAMGWRACFVTHTKGLQDQLLDDFGCIGMVDIRGRANYQCKLAATMTCEDGAHAKCMYSKGNQCPYRADLNRAIGSNLVTTNYHYWMLIHKYGEGIGNFDLVVFDEAHEADKAVCSILGVRITAKQVYRMLEGRFPDNADDAGIEVWRTWARSYLPRASRVMEEMSEELRIMGYVPEPVAKEFAQWSTLVKVLTSISTAVGPWVAEAINTREGSGYRLEPLWPGTYAKDALFLGVPNVVMSSATVNRKTMSLLGLGPDDYDYQQYPYLFPVRRSPIYFVNTSYLDKNSDEADWRAQVEVANIIIGQRLDRKGLIQAVSYKRRDDFLQDLDFGGYMMTHDQNSQSTREAVKLFKLADPPRYLISPSIHTGYSFDYDWAEFQIIPKLPFPVVSGSKIMEARCRKNKGGDPDYSNHLMAQSLQQMFGRIMRAPDDQGETFVTDNNWLWVRKRLRHLFSNWVWPLVMNARTPPFPPPPLPRGVNGARQRQQPSDVDQDNGLETGIE
jgi:Rad3-related DNA helicase